MNDVIKIHNRGIYLYGAVKLALHDVKTMSKTYKLNFPIWSL